MVILRTFALVDQGSIIKEILIQTTYIMAKDKTDVNPWRQVPMIDKINKVANARHDNPQISSSLLLMRCEFIKVRKQVAY